MPPTWSSCGVHVDATLLPFYSPRDGPRAQAHACVYLCSMQPSQDLAAARTAAGPCANLEWRALAAQHEQGAVAPAASLPHLSRAPSRSGSTASIPSHDPRATCDAGSPRPLSEHTGRRCTMYEAPRSRRVSCARAGCVHARPPPNFMPMNLGQSARHLVYISSIFVHHRARTIAPRSRFFCLSPAGHSPAPARS